MRDGAKFVGSRVDHIFEIPDYECTQIRKKVWLAVEICLGTSLSEFGRKGARRDKKIGTELSTSWKGVVYLDRVP